MVVMADKNYVDNNFIYAASGYLVIRDALEYVGSMEYKDWNWERLPHSHPIFHCYFDFPDGPPIGSSAVCYQLHLRNPDGWLGARAPDPPKVEAIELGGRLIVIRDNAGYVSPWGDWGTDGIPSERNSSYSIYNPTRQLEWGVNTIVFALTQEGSITRRLMDSVR